MRRDKSKRGRPLFTKSFILIYFILLQVLGLVVGPYFQNLVFFIGLITQNDVPTFLFFVFCCIHCIFIQVSKLLIFIQFSESTKFIFYGIPFNIKLIKLLK